MGIEKFFQKVDSANENASSNVGQFALRVTVVRFLENRDPAVAAGTCLRENASAANQKASIFLSAPAHHRPPSNNNTMDHDIFVVKHDDKVDGFLE